MKLLSETLHPLTDSEYKNSKSLYAIDLMKFIMAFCVVGIHTTPLKTSIMGSFLLFGVFRLAVPFFFISSSWLLFRKIDLDCIKAKTLKKYIYRLLIMYLLWTLIYIPIIFEKNISFMTVLKDIVLIGYGHLWYLLASIYAVILIYILLRRKIKKGALAFFALCAFFIGLSVSGYYKLIGGGIAKEIADVYLEVFISPRNGLLFAFPYMVMGVFLSQNKRNYGKKQTLYALGGLYVLHLVEMFIIRKFDLCNITDMTLVVLPLTMVLVYTLIHVKLKERKIYAYFRNSSIIIYLIHPYIIKLYDTIIKMDNSLVRYVVVCIASLIIAIIILRLEKYKYFSFLKYLH